MHVFARAALAAWLVVAAGSAQAIQGTFVLDDGSYSITVEEADGNLVVVEPNKRSPYAPDGSGAYTFHNPNTGSNFYLKVIDDNTLEAGRVGSSTPSILKRVDTAGAAAALEENSELTAIAERYSERAQSEPEVQAWSFCAAVAFKRAMGENDEAAQFARQSAQLLQSILVGSSNPCPDAIPAQYW